MEFINCWRLEASSWLRTLNLNDFRKHDAPTYHLKEREVGVGYSIEVDAGVFPLVGPAGILQRDTLIAPRHNAYRQRLACRLVDALDELAAEDRHADDREDQPEHEAHEHHIEDRRDRLN